MNFVLSLWQLRSPSTSHLLYEFVHLLQGKVREVGLGVFSFLFAVREMGKKKKHHLGNVGHPIVPQSGS